MVIIRPQRLQSKLEPSEVVYKGDADIFYIKKFLDASVHGLAGHMTQDNQDQFKQPLCVVYYKVDWKLDPKGEIITLVYVMSTKKTTLQLLHVSDKDLVTRFTIM